MENSFMRTWSISGFLHFQKDEQMHWWFHYPVLTSSHLQRKYQAPKLTPEKLRPTVIQRVSIHE